MRNDKNEIVCDICGEPAVPGEFTVARFAPGYLQDKPMVIFDLCEDCGATIRRRVLSMMGDEDC